MKCKICGQDSGKYVVCWEHRNTKYKDTCKIHGKTWFINRQCQKCKELKTAIYIIEDGRDRFGVKINKGHFLYPYKKRLTHLNKRYQAPYQQRISHTSGIYGIFYKSTCLYVGQSVDISTRIKQHKENFKKAKFQINGTKLHKQRISISKMPHKVEYKYYEMAKEYNLPDLSYKTLFKVPKLKDEFEYNELLTYAEQAMIESYQPKFNHIAARPTRKANLKGNGRTTTKTKKEKVNT